MIKKNLVLTGILISVLLRLAATLYYPGGSQYDKNAVGWDWKTNYLSNLFGDFTNPAKVSITINIVWVLWLVYFTKKEEFDETSLYF